MKLLKNSALLALLTACYLSSSSQGSVVPVNEPNYNKPKVFADLPERFSASIPELNALLELPVGTQVNSVIASGFALRGTVVSNSNPANKAFKSVVIKTPSRKEATLTFTRITKQDGTVSYIGRMMSKDAGDAMEIVKDGNEYVFRKKGFYDLINE